MVQNRKDIEQYYSTKRAQQQQEQSMRISAFVEQSPEYAALRKQLLSLREKAALATLSQMDAQDACDALANFTSAFEEAQKRLLQKYGYPEDYLDLHYECPLCQDTGYVGEQRKMLCTCFKEKLPSFKLGGLDRIPTFNAFDADIFPTEQQRNSALLLRDYLQTYVEAFPHTPKNNFMLCGQTGLGKSFLLGCTASALMTRGFSVKLVTAYHLMELFHAQHMGESECMRSLIGTDFLAIDDLGTEPVYRNITIPYLFTLLNERSLQQKHTAVATNLSPDVLVERYGERISSRLLDQTRTRLFALSGKDLRLCKR